MDYRPTILFPSMLVDIGFDYSPNDHKTLDLYVLKGVCRVYFFPKKVFYAAHNSKSQIQVYSLEDVIGLIGYTPVRKSRFDK